MEITHETQKEDLFKIEVKYLLDICKNLKELLTDVRLQINKDGLRIIEIDPSNVCLIDVVLNNSCFISLTDREEIKFYGININSLYQLLKDNKKESVSISTENNKLFLNFTNGFKSELYLIDIESDKKETPSLEFNASFEIESKKFKEIITNMSNVADSVLIEVKDDKLRFFSEGLNKSEIDINSDEVRITGNAKSKYSLEYLKNFVKCLISEKVLFKFDNDHPATISFLTNGFKLNYILAPRVEETD